MNRDGQLRPVHGGRMAKHSRLCACGPGDGQTYLRKVDLAYLRDRTQVQPACSIRPKKSKTKKKGGKKKK